MFQRERSQFPIGVAIFVIKEGKLLLGKRKDVTYHDGMWGLPGGHLEKGEKIVDAARRELEEETGLRASGFEFMCADNDVRKDGFHYIHFGFLAQDVDGEPRLREPEKCYEWKWFSLMDLPQDIFLGHAKLLKAWSEKKLFIE